MTDPPQGDDAAPWSLHGRTALVTGVSRRRGIGFAVARELARRGASVFFHHYSPHDAEQPWGQDDIDAVRRELRDSLVAGAQLGDAAADLRDPDAPALLVRRATALTGRLDVMVCNQARSGGDGSILDMTAERLDEHWWSNARATLLLTRAFAAQSADAGAPVARPGDRTVGTGPHDPATARRVFWMTSGQLHSAMPGEVAYATSKAALAGVTRTVAAELLPLGVILNTVDPGPVNTGYLDAGTTDRDLDALHEAIAGTPFGRFGAPEDPARLIGWLASAEGSWLAGQVLTSDGGFSLR